MKFKEKRVYKHIPKGWKIDENASNHPTGTKWITNGKSRFPGGGKPSKHRKALLVTDEKAMIERIATNRRAGKADYFVTDKTTETKVQAELKRQNRAHAKKPLNKSAAAATAKKRPVKKPAAAKCIRKPAPAVRKSAKKR